MIWFMQCQNPTSGLLLPANINLLLWKRKAIGGTRERGVVGRTGRRVRRERRKRMGGKRGRGTGRNARRGNGNFLNFFAIDHILKLIAQETDSINSERKLKKVERQ